MTDRKHLTSIEVDKPLDAIKGTRNEARDRCFLLLMFRHRLRVSEACSLIQLCHWRNAKIEVHGLYCTITILLRALALHRVRQAGSLLSMKRMLSELDAIREVVTIYPRKPRQKKNPIQTVLTKTSELQQ